MHGIVGGNMSPWYVILNKHNIVAVNITLCMADALPLMLVSLPTLLTIPMVTVMGAH